MTTETDAYLEAWNGAVAANLETDDKQWDAPALAAAAYLRERFVTRKKYRELRTAFLATGEAAAKHLMRVAALTAERDRLREALEPFAKTNVLEPNGVIVGLERWHFDRARQALKQEPTNG